MTFRYPYLASQVFLALWTDVLQTVDAIYQTNQATAFSGSGDEEDGGGDGLDVITESPSTFLDYLLTPRVDALLAVLDERDRSLEDFLAAVPILYDLNPVSVQAPPNVPLITRTGTFTAIGLNGTLSASLTGDTTVNLLRNGSVIETLTIASGTTYKRVTFTPVVFQGGIDSYGISVSGVGTGTAVLAGEIETQ